MNAPLTYVYGVVREDEAGRLEQDAPPAGVAGGPVRLVRHTGLAALTTPVPAAEFDESGLRERLESLEWLEQVARAHQAVVDHASARTCVLPLRLATVCVDDDGVRRLLDNGRERFTAALDALSGRVEWGVKVFAEPALAAAETGASASAAGDRTPAAAPAGAPAEGGRAAGPRAERGAGRAYLRQRSAARRAEERRTTQADACAREVHRTLSGAAERNRLHRPQHPKLSGRQAENLLNAAYLVRREEAEEFARRVRELASGQEDGIRVELTGPWAPYSFVEEGADRR